MLRLAGSSVGVFALLGCSESPEMRVAFAVVCATPVGSETSRSDLVVLTANTADGDGAPYGGVQCVSVADPVRPPSSRWFEAPDLRSRPDILGGLRTDRGTNLLLDAPLRGALGHKTWILRDGLPEPFVPDVAWPVAMKDSRVLCVSSDSGNTQFVALGECASKGNTSKVQLLRTDGTGQATEKGTWELPIQPRACLVGKFGPEGEMSLLIADAWSGGTESQSGSLWMIVPGRKEPVVMLEGKSAREGLGIWLLDADDLDGDGRPELIIGRHEGDPSTDRRKGSVAAWSVATRKEFWRVFGHGDYWGLQQRGSLVGDVDKDGIRDLAYVDVDKGVVVSGRTGEALRELAGGVTWTQDHSRSVIDLVGAGDRDADGVGDFAVAYSHARDRRSEPEFEIVSGSSSAVLYRAEHSGGQSLSAGKWTLSQPR